MRKETVSPNRNCLQEILSQIPEKKTQEDRRAIRSPYTWIAITEIATVLSLFLAILPSYITLTNGSRSYEIEIQKIDSNLDSFERLIDNEDYQKTLDDYSL